MTTTMQDKDGSIVFAHKREPGRKSECRSCGAAIVWTKTASGKQMPCDYEPAEAGDFFLFRKPDRIESVYKGSVDDRIDRAYRRGQKMYSSNFATCPNASRKKG